MRSGSTGRDLRTCPVLLAIFLLIFNVRLVKPTSDHDPYRILGVSRSASQAEIKRAYKSLAREWHPDKNKDPKAEDMFIKISKSYEILSNEERRSNFDHYGQMDDNQPFGQSQHHGFRSFHNNFYFDESFFHFPRSRDFADSKYMLRHAQFNSDVLPDSYKKPYLIKVTSEWCFACLHIEPAWKETVQELEPLGVGIGIVDLSYERRLANQLGAHRAPSIIGLVNGRVTFYHQAVVREHLRQFVEDLLPQKLVERINDNNYMAFLDSWHAENKPSLLLFDQIPVVPLLYKLTAFAYRDFVRFGYVDQGETHNTKLLRQFNINTYAPTMLLFKEDTEKPVDIIQARGMKKQIAVQKVTAQEKTPRVESNDSSDEEEEEEKGDIQLEMVDLTLTTLDLRESEMYPSRNRRRKKKKKTTKKQNDEISHIETDYQEGGLPGAATAEETDTPQLMQPVKQKRTKAQSQKQVDDEWWDYGVRDALYTACKVGDVDALSSLLQLPEETADSPQQPEGNPALLSSPTNLLNKPIDSSGFTLLHVAAAAAQKEVVRELLDAGADPACRDCKGQTPYIVAPDKDTRNVFRKYMAENPEKYDYSKAQVPGPLTAEIESKKMEKKKAQRAQRKQREKEQKEEKMKQELEMEEKKKFASLTDREKRALAAEKRLAEQVAATGVGLSNIKRCWSCGDSLLGKIPFHYLEYSFCTPRCVQAHRKANVPPGKN